MQHSNSKDIMKSEFQMTDKRRLRGFIYWLFSIGLIAYSIWSVKNMEYTIILSEICGGIFVVGLICFVMGFHCLIKRQIIVTNEYVEYRRFWYQKMLLDDIIEIYTGKVKDGALSQPLVLIFAEIIFNLLPIRQCNLSLKSEKGSIVLSINEFSEENLQSLCNYLSDKLDFTKIKVNDEMKWFES